LLFVPVMGSALTASLARFAYQPSRAFPGNAARTADRSSRSFSVPVRGKDNRPVSSLACAPGLRAWPGGRRRGGDHVVEHLPQRGEVTAFGCDPRGRVVALRAGQSPVQPPPGVTGYPRPEYPLGAPVPLPERVNVVERVIVMSQPLDEPLTAHPAQVVSARSSSNT
jgi:hypothetical protein